VLEHLDLVLQSCRLGFGDIQSPAVGAFHGRQISCDAGFDLLTASCNLVARVIPIPIIDRLELASVDGHHGIREALEAITRECG